MNLFDTRAQAAVATIGSDNTLLTGGYFAPGDLGGALYARAPGATPGGFQSADGAWWTIVEPVLRSQQFGAVGDAKYATGAITITAGQRTLQNSAANWTPADAGKLISVQLAGPSGRDLITMIVSVQDGQHCTLAAPASTTVSGANATAFCGTDDTAALQSLINAAQMLQVKGTIAARTYAYTTLSIPPGAPVRLSGMLTSDLLFPSGVGIGTQLWNFSSTLPAMQVKAPFSIIEAIEFRYPGSAASRWYTGNLTYAFIVPIGVQGTQIADLRIYNQGSGILDNGGIEFARRSVVDFGAGYGWTTTAGEVDFERCQSNQNGLSGFVFTGAMVGLFASRLTSVANGGYGIEVSGTASDIYIDIPEVGNNRIGQIYIGSAGQSFGISNGLVEQEAGGPLLVGTMTGLKIRGVANMADQG